MRLLLLLTMCIAVVFAGPVAGSTMGGSEVELASRSGNSYPGVEKYLMPGGRVDLEALRASGYQGALDLQGFNVRLDPLSGEPLVLPSGASAAAGDPDDKFWKDGYCFPGVNSEQVLALTVYNGNLIVGGFFTAAGCMAANCIASWDGIKWLPLGSGMNNSVFALTVYNGNLIAGGYFTTAGGVAASRIASWNGSAWSALGAGMGSGVRALTVYNSKLIAGGEFTTAGGPPAAHIAAWDGSIWSTLGSGMNYIVMALAVYSGDLYAGGSFTNAGGTPASRIARWNGASWSALGLGTSNDVAALAVYGANLYVGGFFLTAGGVGSRGIASWNGSSWSAVGGGVLGNVYALTEHNSTLIVGGLFGQAGFVAANDIAAWNGSSWTALGAGSPAVKALTSYNGNLVDGSWADVRVWNGSTWFYFGSGLNGYISALAIYNNKLIAGGNFSWAGNVPANCIASWDGSTWSPLGVGLNSTPKAMTVYGGKLIVGGVFTEGGGSPKGYIAAWDGGSWSALGTGMNYMVLALTSYGGDLIAGGAFSTAGSVSAPFIARWNGSSWASLGIGMDAWVLSLAVYGSNLVAGGDFTLAGGETANHIAEWNGSLWAPLGEGTNDRVQALIVYGDRLIAGGVFTYAGTTAVSAIASWDGSNWRPLGSGVVSSVSALAIFGGHLIAGGSFTTAGGKPASNIAAWNGLEWSPLGSGVGSYGVWSMTADANLLTAGGNFSFSGGKVSAYIAQWTKSQVPVISQVRDVPFDQGGKLQVLWNASPLDKYTGAEITYYSLWRWVKDPWALRLAESSTAPAMPSITADYKGPGLYRTLNGWVWEWLANVPARQAATYAYTAPSLYDSMGADPHWQYFVVTAHTDTVWTYYDSPADSGYSVDNLAPLAPVGLAGSQSYQPVGLALGWQENGEADLHHYAVYRGLSAEFVPESGNRVAMPTQASCFDGGWRWDGGYYYKVAAVDVHGNESGYALLAPNNITDVETPKAPAATYLSQNFPNPFNPVTKIEFGLAAPAAVSLRIYDAAGRLVRIVVEGTLAEGRYTKSWDGRDESGGTVSSGVYFYRLDAGSFTRTRKMVLLR